MRKFLYGLSILTVVAAIGSVYGAALVPPSVNGPWLGDQNSNLWSIINAHIQGSGYGNHGGLSVSQTSAQANCTQLDSNVLQEVKTSASTGYVCLPAAVSGKMIFIGNAAGQTIDLYGAPTTASAVLGTQDTINGTTGSTAYTGVTTGKNAICFAPATGAWYCGSIS
jgi:hypothetical protein